MSHLAKIPPLAALTVTMPDDVYDDADKSLVVLSLLNGTATLSHFRPDQTPPEH